MSKRPLLLGHRGTRSVASVPENTFAAFDRALDDGCDGFEFDVRLTADGRAVICHDPRYHDVTIAQAGAAQLQELPTLSMVLERYATRAFLDIELKVAGLEKYVTTILEKHGPARGYLVSSFMPEVLHAIRNSDPDIPLGFICDRQESLVLWRELPVQYVVPHYQLVSREFISEVHQADKILMIWTVNAESQMLCFAEWGVDAVISDDTRRLVRVLGNASS